MYCPRCGHQTISDELRFCSYCGLKLGVVKASLAESDDTSSTEKSSLPTVLALPRHRDINIGVILMFGGAVLAAWVAGVTGLGLGRTKGAAVFLIFYLVLLALSGPITNGIHKLLSWKDEDSLSTSRRGVGFGATLMFFSTVVLAITSLFMYGRMKSTPLFVSIGLAFIVLSLCSRHLMRGLRFLLFDGTTQSLSSSDKASAVTSNIERPSLPEGLGTPVPLFGTPRVITAEIVAPGSITEHTTNLLEK